MGKEVPFRDAYILCTIAQAVLRYSVPYIHSRSAVRERACSAVARLQSEGIGQRPGPFSITGASTGNVSRFPTVEKDSARVLELTRRRP